MVEKRKHRWAILVAVLLGIVVAVSMSVYKPPNMPHGSATAKAAVIICWSAGATCWFLAGAFSFIANWTMTKPGVRWPNCAFDFSIVLPLSDLFTDEGIRTLRKARYCFLLWLLLLAIGVVIVAEAGGFHQGAA